MIVRMALTFAENMRMVSSFRAEARTDALTGLANRRKLPRRSVAAGFSLDIMMPLFRRAEQDGVQPWAEVHGFSMFDPVSVPP